MTNKLPERWADAFPGEWLAAANLPDGETTTTIVDAAVESVQSTKDPKKTEQKIVLTLDRFELRMLVNYTNARALELMFGTNPNNAIGKRITLASRKVEVGGEIKDAIRIVGSPDMTQAEIDDTVKRGMGPRSKTIRTKLRRTTV